MPSKVMTSLTRTWVRLPEAPRECDNPEHDLHPVGRPKLAEYPGQIGADRRLGNAKLKSDLLVPLRDEKLLDHSDELRGKAKLGLDGCPSRRVKRKLKVLGACSRRPRALCWCSRTIHRTPPLANTSFLPHEHFPTICCQTSSRPETV